MSITVYSKPNCVQCTATYRALQNHGLGAEADGRYDIVDLTADPEALGTVKKLGYAQAPVVIVRSDDGTILDHWSGFRPDKIKENMGALQPAAT